MPLIPAATVILVREAAAGPGASKRLDEVEVFLLKRHRASSFMSNAFVFPGGKVDPDDGSPEVAAIRELYEEAGVLLAEPPFDVSAETRARLIAGEVTFPQVIAGANLRLDHSRLHYWARWMTPSAEPKRFDALFFVAELPPGQTPSFDQKETVEELWITPAEALARQADATLRLPPPQVRTMHELVAAGSLSSVVAASRARAAAPVGVCPRIAMGEAGIKIVLPWDPAYADTPGEGQAISSDHLLATPPSQFSWDGKAWR